LQKKEQKVNLQSDNITKYIFLPQFLSMSELENFEKLSKFFSQVSKMAENFKMAEMAKNQGSRTLKFGNIFASVFAMSLYFDQQHDLTPYDFALFSI
jgi:ubiquinone/menaquinone biosynthesis C-methylase UbiE